MDQPSIARNVIEDFQIIRPDSQIPVAQFKDEASGALFYLNGLPCSSGCDAGRLLQAAQANDPIEGRIPEDIFTADKRKFEDARNMLQGLKYPVVDPDLGFVGWRREGDQLVRVSHTSGYRKFEYLLGENGQRQYLPVPKVLRFVDRILISNGLVYNLVDENLNPNDAAEKLVKMAAMSGRGEKQGGDHQFWSNNAQKLIASCIALHRINTPKEATHCGHIFDMVADDKKLQSETKLLADKIIALQSEIGRTADPDKKRELETRSLGPMKVLNTYFTKEWAELDQKPKTTIKSVVTNTFSNFIQDPALKESFCSKPTYNLSEMQQLGRIFAFVPGPQYKNLATVIGTGLKLDAQGNWLARIDRSDSNKERPQLQLIDECWNWTIAGGQGGGDPHFLSLCRQARVINLLATQSYEQFDAVIGREEANNLLSQFGVFIWLQSFNQRTNGFAEDLMVKTKRENLRAEQNDQTARIQQTWEETRQFTAQDFVKLDGDESIVFNGYQKHEMARKTKLPKSYITHPDEKEKIALFMRRLSQGQIEQSLWKEKRSDRVDPFPNGALPKTTPATTPAPHSPAPQLQTNPPPKANPAPPTAPTVPEAPKPEALKAEPEKEVESSSKPAEPPAPNATPAQEQERAEPDLPPPVGQYRKMNFREIAKNQKHWRPVSPEKPLPRVEATETKPPPRTAPKPKVERKTADLTPSTVDAQSADYIAKWDRLVNAVTEVSSDDEFGFNSWLKKLLNQDSSAGLVPGPNGHSVGDANLKEASSPRADSSELQHLGQREQEVRESRHLMNAERAFTEREGIPHNIGWDGQS